MLNRTACPDKSGKSCFAGKKLLFTLLLLVPLFSMYSQDTINVPADYATIQAAIDAANNGDIVLVAENTYYENINFKGKAITVASHFLIDGDETHIENTIINGSQPSHPDSGSVVFFISGEDTTSILCGFTITGGTGTYTAQFDDVSGGGIYLWPSGAKISNNIIEYNSVSYNNLSFGGGILGDLDTNSLIIENNIIRNNTNNGNFYAEGGGMFFFNGGYVRIVNNKIMDNTASGNNAYGGGIDYSGASNEVHITNNYIKGNTANSNNNGGGGISVYNGTPVIKNNLIVGNSAYGGGGVLVELGTSTSSKSGNNNTGRLSLQNSGLNSNQNLSKVTLLETLLENNTIIYNTATYGGGVRSTGYTPVIMNSIIWGNTAPSGPQIYGTADVQYSDVQGGYTGTGNMDGDPLFAGNFEYYFPTSSSPCIDAGNPDPQYNDIEFPIGSGDPLYPSQGALRNDMGHVGGPNSTWGYRPWPLPVELTSFTAVTEFGKVTLNWTTATEVNNLGFEIERKIINENEGVWLRIGFREGHGTTTEPNIYSFIDDMSDIRATSLLYRLKQIDFNGTYEYSEEVLVDNLAPVNFVLEQNYPNPFNPSTMIRFGIPVKSNVVLKIFNSIGEEVAQLVNEDKPSGAYSLEFDATNFTSGVYFYQLQAGDFIETKKMILLR